MKKITLFILLIVFVIKGFGQNRFIPPMPLDTCFYYIKVPPDIDMPTTPHFDTTIVKNRTCNVLVIIFNKWGTATDYTLANLKCGCKAGGEECKMDITSLPAGTYEANLYACGNGGSFTIHIK
jgi:hypothetical protein